MRKHGLMLLLAGGILSVAAERRAVGQLDQPPVTLGTVPEAKSGASPIEIPASSSVSDPKTPTRRLSPPGPVDEAFHQADADGDGFVTPLEFAIYSAFKKWDVNGDGRLEKGEFERFFASNPVPGGGLPGARVTSGSIADSIMIRLDANGDGRVSKEEAPEILRQVFDELDRNKDGFLDAEDSIRPMQPRGAAPRGNPLGAMLRYDTNKDGKVQLSELPENLQRAFKNVDANKDGVLDADEIERPAPNAMGPEHEAMAEKLRERNKAMMESRRKAAQKAGANAPADGAASSVAGPPEPPARAK